MTGPSGNSEFCFPSTLDVPRGGARETKLTVPLGASHLVLIVIQFRLYSPADLSGDEQHVRALSSISTQAGR